jgi:rubrerythrin
MKKLSVNEVIEQAIRTEHLGYEFYTKTAQKFESDMSLNTLFSTLAQKELQHEEKFMKLKDNVDDDEGIENWEEVSNYFRAVVESEFFLGKNKSLPSLDNITSVSEAVKFAIGFERETLLYFCGLREAVKEADVIEEIIKEEKSHIMWLSKYRDSLQAS